MKLSITRSGGLAGISESLGSVDTASLPPARARQIEQQLEALRFFELPPVFPASAVGADMFRYTLTATRDDTQHTVVFTDDGRPELQPLRALIREVGAPS